MHRKSFNDCIFHLLAFVTASMEGDFVARRS